MTETLIVRPDETWVLDPTPARTLTLITCYPFSYVGPAPSRFVVRATAATGNRPTCTVTPIAIATKQQPQPPGVRRPDHRGPDAEPQQGQRHDLVAPAHAAALALVADVAAEPGAVDELQIEAFRTARVARGREQQEDGRGQQRQEDPQHAQGHREGAADDEERTKESPPTLTVYKKRGHGEASYPRARAHEARGCLRALKHWRGVTASTRPLSGLGARAQPARSALRLFFSVPSRFSSVSSS